jgi:hypothetical protein
VPTTSACHHESGTTATVVAGAERCYGMVSDAPVLVRQDVRGGEGLDKQQGAPVPLYRFAAFSMDARPGQEPEHELSLERRPPVTALRI